MKKLLLVEDDLNIAEPLCQYLKTEKYLVFSAQTLMQARNQLSEINPDLIILDWNLPDGQGIDWLNELKALRIPVIFLTARQDLIDKVVGLEMGANDFVTKPFEPRELLARIRAQMRFSKGEIHQNSYIEANKIEMNISERMVKWEGNSIDLTKKEFDLLKLFLENPNKVFNRDELLNMVWGYEEFPTTRTVDNHILKLRQIFSEDFFETIRGVGYRFKKVS